MVASPRGRSSTVRLNLSRQNTLALVTTLVIVLLTASLLLSAAGIWFTARPSLRESPDDPGIFEVAPSKTWWQRTRGVILLGLGLTSNTVAALLALIP